MIWQVGYDLFPISMPISEAIASARGFLTFAQRDCEYGLHEKRYLDFLEQQERWLKHGMELAQVFVMYAKAYPQDLQLDERTTSPKNLEKILIGIILHDAIGKPHSTREPSVWNLDREALLATDRVDMQNHHEVGFQRAQFWFGADPTMQVALEIIHRHHEKCDGSGPLKKIESEISKILQLVILIDSILSPCEIRSYHKNHYTLPQSFKRIRTQGNGKYNLEFLEKLEALFIENRHLQYPELEWLGEY